MDDISIKSQPSHKKKFEILKRLRSIQNKISGSSYSYLFYTFAVPLVLMYLIYLSQGIHPFGNGSVLVLDLNGQYVYFFESLRNAVFGNGSFLYTFFRALGGEYMGLYAYYLASPLSYIVCLFPASRILEALLTIILIKTGLCGFTFGFYLHKHSKNPNKVMITAFSVMYALCSFAVVHQNNMMWTDAVIWLPIIAYSIEQLILNGKYKLFVISLAVTMMSNYYIGYMVCIFCVVYFFYYYLSCDKEICNPNSKKYHCLISFIRFGIAAILAAAVAAFIIFAAYYSLSFGKNEFSDPNWALKAKFDLLDFFTKFLPGAYDTVRPNGLPFVYCGILVPITVPVYFTCKVIKVREKIASVALIGFFVLCFIASPLDLIWHGFQNPNWLNYRYSFMLCFILLILAYKGYANLRQCNEKFVLAICAFIVLFVAICQKMDFDTYEVTDQKLGTFSTVWFTVIITVALFTILCIALRTQSFKIRESVTAILACVICVEMFCNALAMVIQFDDDVTYSSYNGYNDYISELRPVVNELKEYDPSFYRMEKNFHRKYNDNMALGIRGLSNSTSTLNASTIAFLNNMGYTSRSHLSKYQGGNPVNDSLLGIKYIIDKNAVGSNYDTQKEDNETVSLNDFYQKELSNGNYDIYLNPYALSLAYGVSDNVLDFDFDNYTTYFDKLNALAGTMAGYDSVPDIFKPTYNVSEQFSGCMQSGSSVNKTYTKATENANAYVTFSFVATETAEYYFHLPSNKPKECTLYIKITRTLENGSKRIENYSLGNILGNDTRHIFSLGMFENGTQVELKVSLKDDPLNIIGGRDYVWYIDREEYDRVFEDLNSNPQFAINDDFTDDHLTGTIRTDKNSTMILTTIAYDKGWQIYVDGEQVETYQVLDALIAFNIDEAGEHTLEMKYMPSIYSLGMKISVAGIAVFIVICVVEAVLKKLRRNKSTPIQEYWALEDFDEDYEQSLSQKSIHKKYKPIKLFRKKKDKENGDN